MGGHIRKTGIKRNIILWLAVDDGLRDEVVHQVFTA